MPIKLKNRDSLPASDYETVSILGLDVPLTRDLPFGAQVELLDLQQRFNEGDFGQLEYVLRLFCVFTRRLPKAEHVRYEWLAAQSLDADEIAELMSGTLRLLGFLQVEGDSGNAPKRRAKGSSTP